MKFVAYVRVSTDRQDYDVQLAAFTNDGLAVERLYSDTASGRSRKLPELERLLTDADSGKLRGATLVVFALDRLSRKGPSSVFQILDRLQRGGVFVRSIRETWLNVEGPMRSLLVSIAAWVAEYEAGIIRERVKAGLAAARARGVTLGRRLSCSPDAVNALRKEGRSVRQIAAALNCSRSAVSRVLKGTRRGRAIAASTGGPQAPERGTA